MADHTYSNDLNVNVSAQGSPENVVPQTPVNLTTEVSNVQHQVLNFQESTPSPTLEFSSNVDPTYCFDSTGMDELKDFLSRPVLIHDLTWTEGTPFVVSNHRIWEEFIDHPIIQKKMDNYSFANFNLHLKFVINASPFYYGALMVTYKPLPLFVAAGSNISFTGPSQRPHVWIMPQCNQGSELVIPFFYHKNWLNITSRSDVQEMGEIDIFEVVPLTNANGVTGDSVNMQVYAWAENVKLTGATAKLALQSGKPVSKSGSKDEYGQGPVSRIASSVAASARALVTVPYIAPFAKATEIGASAVSKIASLFGFTNVPVISDVMPYKNLPFHGMASANIGQPAEKLTIDPKNELCVDPRTVGLGSGDEMSIAYIVQKECLLAVCTWSSTDASDTQLFGAPVQPSQWNSLAVTAGVAYELAPMCMIAQNFTFWRGDIIFRFKVVCTQYHKGRLRVTWDPSADLATTTDTQTSSFTRIVDLSPDLDFEVRCNYLQARHWLSNQQIIDFTTVTSYSSIDTGGVITYPTGTFNNGVINVRVLNELTSPVAASDIKILVFVRGADNLEFAYPRVDESNRLSYFAPQSGNWLSVDSSINANNDRGTPPMQEYVYQGESVKSMRSLLRRTTYEMTSGFQGVSVVNPGLQIVSYNLTKYPRPPGWDPSSPTDAVNSVAVPQPYTYAKWSAYHWFVPCFVGSRGSINRMYNLNTTGGNLKENIDHFAVSEQSATIPRSGGRITEVGALATGVFPNNVAYAGTALTNGGSGQAMVNKMSQTGLAVVHPHYYPYRFVGTDPVTQAIGNDRDDTLYHHNLIQFSLFGASLGQSLEQISLERYVSIGTDFSVFFFLQVPKIYLYTTSPVPP